MNKINITFFIFALSIGWLTSCSTKQTALSQPQSSIQNNSTNQNKKASEEKPLEKLATSTHKTKLPTVKDFGVTHLRRISNNKDEGGLLLPPFGHAEIDTAHFVEVEAGEKYTIVPLNVNIKPFQLPIIKATKTTNGGCDEKEPDFLWVVEFERITNKEILEIAGVGHSTPEYPFDVFLIYPAVKFAKNILQSELEAGMLPKDISVNTVEAAIDLDNDKKPDLIEVRYCCSDKFISPKENDCYTCLKLFKKVKGIWKLVDEAMPC